MWGAIVGWAQCNGWNGMIVTVLKKMSHSVPLIPFQQWACPPKAAPTSLHWCIYRTVSPTCCCVWPCRLQSECQMTPWSSNKFSLSNGAGLGVESGMQDDRERCDLSGFGSYCLHDQLHGIWLQNVCICNQLRYQQFFLNEIRDTFDKLDDYFLDYFLMLKGCLW